MPDDAAQPVRLLCLDVDGVLTDGGIALDDRGVETKRFHVRDGLGVRLWTRLGHDVAIITGRSGLAVAHRAAELGIATVVQRCGDKGAALRRLRDERGLAAEAVAVLGDDLPDLPMMREAGYPMAVADAVAEVRDAAAHVTGRSGGDGAVREAVEHLLRAQGRWTEALAAYAE